MAPAIVLGSASQGTSVTVDHLGRMERGLYIAASGMIAEMVRQDQVSNDLANTSTAGYKGDRATQQSFNQMLLSNTLTGQPVGTMALGTRVDSIVTDMTQGALYCPLFRRKRLAIRQVLRTWPPRTRLYGSAKWPRPVAATPKGRSCSGAAYEASDQPCR